ncbi:MAG: carbohydrate ABC transporter substrate-binding protein, partial [Anaerolineae bacterium]|nr:carbohydrate ABC transporter substrate-binding protein [Anaerolineae bacterium]
ASAQDDLSGTTITVFAGWTDETEVMRVEEGFAVFEERTGADVQYTGSSDFETLIQARVEAGDPPDVACFPQPGLMARFVDTALDLTEIMDEEYLREQYAEAWLDMATVNGKMIGLWHRVTLKSLVWYSPDAFDFYGYEVPETWDELIALSDQMVADGFAPWYAPMESGAATGWVGSDWIEDILLRTTSLENYDAWTVPQYKGLERLPFDSPEVRRAFELMGDILLNEDYVYGGTAAILGVSFFDSGVPLLEDPPNAFLVKQGSSMPLWLDEMPEIGPEGDLNYFYFPPIDEEYGSPALVAGDICAIFDDRPEVREFAEFLATADVLEPWVRAGGALSPHNDAELDWYPPADRGVAEILENATAFRFDGGDLQPGPVGQGSFWEGIGNYINGDSLDDILPAIDAAWPED